MPVAVSILDDKNEQYLVMTAAPNHFCVFKLTNDQEMAFLEYANAHESEDAHSSDEETYLKNIAWLNSQHYPEVSLTDAEKLPYFIKALSTLSQVIQSLEFRMHHAGLEYDYDDDEDDDEDMEDMPFIPPHLSQRNNRVQ